MFYSHIETRYITSESNERLVRYDRIKIDNDTYVVKVWDDQQRGISQPSLIHEVETIRFTRSSYNEEYGLGGFQRTVAKEFPPAFEDYVWKKCQEHRNSIPE